MCQHAFRQHCAASVSSLPRKREAAPYHGDFFVLVVFGIFGDALLVSAVLAFEESFRAFDAADRTIWLVLAACTLLLLRYAFVSAPPADGPPRVVVVRLLGTDDGGHER